MTRAFKCIDFSCNFRKNILRNHLSQSRNFAWQKNPIRNTKSAFQKDNPNNIANDEMIKKSLEKLDRGEIPFESRMQPEITDSSKKFLKQFKPDESSMNINRKKPVSRVDYDESNESDDFTENDMEVVKGNNRFDRTRTPYERPSYSNNYNRGPREVSRLYQGGRVLLDDGRVKPQDEGYEGDHIFGLMPVKAALLGGRRSFTELLVQEGMELAMKKDEASAREVLTLAQKLNITLREFPKHDLNMLVDNKPHQGFILRAKPLDLEVIDSLPVSETFSCVLALDEVVDPMNVGALLRSSLFLGCSKVIICSKNSAPLSPTVAKASAGALEFVDICSTKNLMKFLDKSKLNGWQVVGTSLEENSIDMKDLEVSKPTILVLGNEGHGIRTNILKRCDSLLKIKGSEKAGMVDSLNVSVSGAILLHHIINNSKLAK